MADHLKMRGKNIDSFRSILSSPNTLLILLGISTFVVFFPVIHNDFIYSFDDADYVTGNVHVNSGITVESIIWAFTSVHANNWHPVTWLSHMLDCELYGLNAGMHHLTSLAVHILTTFLIFAFLYLTTGLIWQSIFVSALFALHPIHVESVAWIAERKDVLSAFFWFATILCYTWYTKKKNSAVYVLSLIIFAIGLMSKPMVVTLPFVLLLLDYWPLGRVEINGKSLKSAGILIIEKIPFFMFSAASSYVTIIAQSEVGAGLIVKSLTDFTLADRIANAIVSYVHYLYHIFIPLRLGVYYPYPDHVPAMLILAALLILTAISILCVYTAKSRPYLLVGWLWYLGTLIPVIGIVQVAEQAMADRYMYIPSVGIFIMIVWGISELLSKFKYRITIMISFTMAVIIALSIIARIQVSYWRDSKTLFNHTLEVTKGNFVTHYALGRVYNGEGNQSEAIYHYGESLKIKPDFANAHFHLGLTFKSLDRFNEAIEQFNEVLKTDSNYLPAHYEIAFILKNNGDLDGAIQQLRKAVEGNPSSGIAYNYLGLTLLEAGRLDEAIQQFSKALEIDSQFADAHNNIGLALFHKRSIKEAVAHFRAAHSLLPQNEQIKENLKYASGIMESIKEKGLD